MTFKLDRSDWFDFDDNPAASVGQSPNGKWKAAYFRKYRRPGNLVIVRGKKIIAYFVAPIDSLPVMINDSGVAALINSKGPGTPSRIDFYFPDRTKTSTSNVGAAGYAHTADFNDSGDAIIIKTSKGETTVPISQDARKQTGKSLAEIKAAAQPARKPAPRKEQKSGCLIWIIIALALGIFYYLSKS